MLSNRTKSQLMEKFNLFKKNVSEKVMGISKKEASEAGQSSTSEAGQSSTSEAGTDSDSDDEEVSSPSASTSASTSEAGEGEGEGAGTDKANKDYTYFADNLVKDFPKKAYTNVKVCLYQINKEELHPFLMFLLYKDEHNVLDFPTEKLNGIDPILAKFREIFAEWNAEIEYKGFIKDGEGIVLVLEYDASANASSKALANTKELQKGTYNNKWWWVLTAEVINVKEVLNFPIKKSATDFLLKNQELCLLKQKKTAVVYETPEVGYYGNYYKKIAAVASLGLSRESPYASFGPFYYFSNYTHAIRNAFWSNKAKPVKIGEEYITVDDKGRYDKGGIVRFALFSGKTKMLLGRPTDLPDDSHISEELAEKSPFVKSMLKLRDSGAKWIAEYNSIRIGSHTVTLTDKGTDIHTNPLIALREYEQQVPLEYYFVDTKQDIKEADIQKAVIL